jgi:hypothetical protein
VHVAPKIGGYQVWNSERVSRHRHIDHSGGIWSSLRRVNIGIAGLALTALCATAAFAAVLAPLGSADEVAHIDYAYQVWHGHLPVFEHGLAWHPPAPRPPVQIEAQHPPLFYLLLAPVVGPIADSGHWVAAVMAGRAICVLIAVGAVLALAWAGSQMTTRNRTAWAIVVPAVVTPVRPFLAAGGSVYNDDLQLGLIALAIGLAVLIIRNGPTRTRIILAAGIGALGMLSRAQFGATLVLLAAAVFVGAWRTAKIDRRRKLLRAALLAAVPLVSAAVVAGWFYVRNKRLTGTFEGSHYAWGHEHLGRNARSIWKVLTRDKFWNGQIGLIEQSKQDAHPVYLLMAAVAALTVGATAVAVVRMRRRPEAVQVAVFLILAVLAVATFVAEVQYISAGGGLNSRYLLPAILPLGCFIAVGIIALPRLLSVVALLAYFAVAWTLFVRWVADQHTGGQELWSGRTPANVPWLAVVLGLVGLIAGLLLQAIGLYRARGSTPVDESSQEVPSVAPSVVRETVQ